MKLSKTNKKYKLLKNYGNIDSKTIVVKKHLSFSVTNLKSVKLGRISIFGVFEEIGAHGRAICSVLMNYLIVLFYQLFLFYNYDKLYFVFLFHFYLD